MFTLILFSFGRDVARVEGTKRWRDGENGIRGEKVDKKLKKKLKYLEI